MKTKLRTFLIINLMIICGVFLFVPSNMRLGLPHEIAVWRILSTLLFISLFIVMISNKVAKVLRQRFFIREDTLVNIRVIAFGAILLGSFLIFSNLYGWWVLHYEGTYNTGFITIVKKLTFDKRLDIYLNTIENTLRHIKIFSYEDETNMHNYLEIARFIIDLEALKKCTTEEDVHNLAIKSIQILLLSIHYFNRKVKISSYTGYFARLKELWHKITKPNDEDFW